MKKTLIIGLGNPILGDDGVGIAVARELKARLPGDRAITVKELSVGGLRLMEEMAGYDRVIVVDAIKTGSRPAGTVSLLTLDDVSMPLHAASSHDATLSCAITAGRRMGIELPEDISFIAIEVADAGTFGENLSPEVSASLPHALQVAIRKVYSY